MDIRDKDSIGHDDIMALNFIRNSGNYLFRRHYRQGLRSHVMEMLDRNDVKKETTGILKNGQTWFPLAEPIRMFRIFRTRFSSLKAALKEIRLVKILEQYLPFDNFAKSSEFLVDYCGPEKVDILLCGFQEFVRGEDLDPWHLRDIDHLAQIVNEAQNHIRDAAQFNTKQLIRNVQKKAAILVSAIKKMVLEAKYIPDLVGLGNLLLTPDGNIKLVDINNISEVSFGPTIFIDDKGFPICDKSIEALALLEEKILCKAIDKKEPIYRHYLTEQRMLKVNAIMKKFHENHKPE